MTFSLESEEDFPEITPILKKETDIHNFGGIWHSDTTYQSEPPMGTMLYGIETTIWWRYRVG